MEKAEDLRASGEALIGCGQYAVDCVQPKCVELERICTEFSSHFNRRRSRLHDAQTLWLAVLHVRIIAQPGASIPQQLWRYSPILTPPFLPHPLQTVLGHCIRNFVHLCVFSVNFGSCQSGIMIPQNTNGVGKAYCMLSFLSGG